MTQQEWRNQRNKAKANLELLQMKLRAKLVTPEAVKEAERILKALMDYCPAEEPVKPVEPLKLQPVAIEPKDGVELPSMPVEEFTRLLEELTLQKSGFHKEMAMRSNRLKDIPDNESAKELVDEIDEFYDRRNEVAVKINFLKANGRLPESSGNEPDPETVKLKFMENLPADKYDLSKVLSLLLPRVSKARKSLQTAKTAPTQMAYSQKLAKLEAEVALVRSRISALS